MRLHLECRIWRRVLIYDHKKPLQITDKNLTLNLIVYLFLGVVYKFMDVGAADKAAIQLVKVQPYQLLVSDT